MAAVRVHWVEFIHTHIVFTLFFPFYRLQGLPAPRSNHAFNLILITLHRTAHHLLCLIQKNAENTEY